MDIFMKTLCILGIPYQHNIHNLKNRQNCTSAVPQVNVHNLPNVHKIPNQHIIYLLALASTPSLYGAGYAKSNFTTCLPAPQRCWGPLGRSDKSCFFGTWFWWISVNCSLATVTTSARIAQTGSNVAQWFYLLHGARDARVCWNRTNIFWFLVCRKWRPKPIFQLMIYWDSFEW